MNKQNNILEYKNVLKVKKTGQNNITAIKFNRL